MRHAHFDCFSGIAGDMTLAALVSAGWPAAELEAVPARLGVAGVEVEVSSVRRGAFAASLVSVRSHEPQPHRHLHHVEAILDRADLPGAVRDRAKQVFRRLAEAEAEVHGSTIEKVHFHEVGAVDAMVDVAGALLGLHDMGVASVSASALPLGGGSVDSQHGRIPIPAPATVLLLKGAPVRGGPVAAELVTPTGAALLSTLVQGSGSWGDPPAFRLEAVGTGAGRLDLPGHPNILRVLIGETQESPGGSGALGSERVVSVLETALDDENPQYLAAAMTELMAQGALDAMVAPVTMKKGRTGMWLVVVCEPADARRLAESVLLRTSTLGVRVREERRIELPRRSLDVETEFGTIRVKLGILHGENMKAMPEFDSLAAAAARTGASMQVIAAAALRALEKLPS